MKTQTFKGFVLESLDLADKIRLVSLGLGDELTWKVLTCMESLRLDNGELESSRLDNGEPVLMCNYYSDWPSAKSPKQFWKLPLVGEYSATEVGQKLAIMLKMARVFDADLLWDLDTGDWYDATTGDLLPEKLHKLLNLGQ
jgi:hypothetical protein